MPRDHEPEVFGYQSKLWEECPSCGGVGTDEDNNVCRHCGGNGWVEAFYPEELTGETDDAR